MSRWRGTLGLILICCALSVAAEDWVYTIRPGDEIWNIANDYCGSPSFASRIIEYNQLADERAIRPGSRLRIPIDWLFRQPVTAEILNVRGQATLLTPESTPAAVGDEIEMGDRLTTADGTAVVGFADGSTLSVSAESEVLFNVLTAFGDTGMVDTNLRFYRGRSTSRIIRRNDASQFRISSPAGTAAVRGTEFRFAVDGSQSLTETLDGEVGFLRDTETSVPAGFGVAASDTGVIRERLLPAPVWISTPGQYASDSRLSWAGVNNATGYRATIFLATDSATPVAVRTTTEPELTLQVLSPADYQVAVRAISPTDLEGYESSLAFTLGTIAPRPTSATEFVASNISLRWQATDTGAPYSIEIATDVDFAEVITRPANLNSARFTPSLNPGRYHWRVKDSTSTFSPAESITIRPEAPQRLEPKLRRRNLSLQWSSSDADAYELRISRNRDFSAPITEKTLAQPTFTGTLPDTGTYHIEVLAVANDIRSTPTVIDVTATQPPPWWLAGLLLLPILF